MPGDVMENDEIGRGSGSGSSGSSSSARGGGEGSGGGGGGGGSGGDIAGSESSGGVSRSNWKISSSLVSDEVTQSSLLRDEHARMWRKSFIQCDGFGAILHLLLCNNINGRSSSSSSSEEEEEEERLDSNTPHRPTIVERTGLSLALRLSKFFLVGMLRQRGIEVKDDRQSPLSTVNGDSHNSSSSSDDDTDDDDSTVVADDDTDEEREEKEGKEGKKSGESKRGGAKKKKREGKEGKDGEEDGNVRQQRPSAVSIGSDHERTSVGSAPASPATSVTSSPTTMTRPPLLRSFR